MNFAVNASDIPGYNQEQVDALLSRIKAQYKNPDRLLVTSSMLAVVKFDLAPGGYQIPAVDEAIAKVADDFEEREIKRRMQLEGRAALVGELTGMMNTIRAVLETKPAKAFSVQRGGYSRKLVAGLLKKIVVRRGELTAPETHLLRTMSLGRSRKGLRRSEVDEFLSLVIAALLRQRTLR